MMPGPLRPVDAGRMTTGGRRPGRPGPMSEASFRALRERLRAQVPWGPQDRRGALNYLTPAVVTAAAGEVRLGLPVPLGAPVTGEVTADNPDPCRHRMTSPAGAGRAAGLAFATDRIAMNVHGNADSHLDALCHVMYDGTLYNGVPATAVGPGGAAELSVEVAGHGIAGRGVLLDIPRLRGVNWLEPGTHVTAADLTRAADAQQVRLGRGDLLFVRVGHRRRRRELGPWDAARQRAGLHPTALEFLAERQVALLGSDGNNDTAASAVPGVAFPVHVLAIHTLGLHLLDYLQFEDLVPICEEAGRWSFLCVIAPLRLTGGTGSPVNPIAIV